MSAGRTALLAALVGSTACSGETLAPTSGALEVTASVVGDGSDPDGFLVVVSGTIQRSLLPGQSLLISAIGAGEHEVAIEGIAPNCAPLGPTLDTTTVVAGDTTHIAFELACDPAGGMLRVRVQTSGSDLDPNGYDVLVDGAREASVEPDGLVLATAPAGNRTVTLGSLNANCVVEPASQSVAIPIGGLVTADFEVQCTASARAGRGHEIAYTVEPAIYVVNDDGSHSERLFPDIELSHSTPAWAPDGIHIAFFQQPVFPDVIPLDSFLLTVADVESGARKEFIHPFSFAISWSPDGFGLALALFAQDECPPLRLFHADGSGEEPFDVGCFPNGTFESLAWSPDGRRIAFVVHVLSDTTDMSILAVADTAVSGHSTSPAGCALQNPTSVAWSPDGSSLAIAAGGIFVLDLGSATCSRVTDDPTDDSPSWSPDGTRLAFSSSRDGNSDIYVMQADGSNQTRITRTSGALEPSWRP
jgi:dipeptidyl aminopeptidase/acylaminoacyl peptidase